MGTITSIVSSLPNDGKTIAICGGCFDILHIGHIKFLAAAKKTADILIVLLESDERVKKLKGDQRPLFAQHERAEVLSQLTSVDIVMTLPMMKSDEEYANLIRQIHPTTIVITEGDKYIEKKTAHANSIGATIAVIPHIETFSSSKLAQMLGIE
jgi:FAD synthetase